MQFFITGRGARTKHINLEGTLLCPQSKATAEATGRFEKLPVCKACAERAMQIAEERATAREEAEAAAKAEAEEKAAEEQPPAEGVQVTLVYTGDGDPAVHRPGCSHIKREKTRSGGHSETITVTSRAAIVEHVYEDIMAEDPDNTVDSLYHCLTWVACVNEVLGYDTEKVELADGSTATEDAVQIHFSARVARYLATGLAADLPGIASDLAAAKHKKMGRGYTAFVVTNVERATQLLELMKTMAEEMNSGKLKTTGMGFRAEAVEKGVEHITADLWSALTPA